MTQHSTLPDAATASTPQLNGRWPNGQPFSISIDRANFTIGRAHGNHLVVPQTAPYVSSRHAEIQQTPAGYVVVDLNSTNGTRINGALVRPQRPMALTNGDTLGLGSKRSGMIELIFKEGIP